MGAGGAQLGVKEHFLEQVTPELRPRRKGWGQRVSGVELRLYLNLQALWAILRPTTFTLDPAVP